VGERFGQVPERVMRDGRLSAWDWRLLLALLVLSRKDRERLFLVPARVRVSTLARMLGEEGELGEAASRKRQVLRALARLESFGYVKRMRRGRVNLYDLNPTWDRAEVAGLVEPDPDQLSLPEELGVPEPAGNSAKHRAWVRKG